MSDGPMKKGIMGDIMVGAGGAVVGLLTRVPKPTMLDAIPDAVYKTGIAVVGGVITQKVLKQPNIAAGMFGVAGYLLTQAMTGGMADDGDIYPLAEYEIVDEDQLDELEELEELEEDDDDSDGTFVTPQGELVMLSDDGEDYYRVSDGSRYIPDAE
jgi:hypothetical protein